MARSEKLSRAQQQAIAFINGHTARELGAIGTEIGKMLAELTAELADAKNEAKHWERSYKTVRDEIKVLAAACMAKLKTRRLVVTKAEFREMLGLELYFDNPEPHTRIYELRDSEGRKALQSAVQGSLSRGSVIELPPGVKPS